MNESCKSPYLMVKPYAAQHLELLAEIVGNNGLDIKSIYSTARWAQVAREIYRKNVDCEGEQFRVGLEGHIKLVNHFFGDRALVLLVEANGQKAQSIGETLCLAQNSKKEFRKILPAGQNLQDIVVMMNLDAVGVGGGSDSSPTGVIGIQTNDNGFKRVSEHQGRWDYYYFKYVHAPDDLTGLYEELAILERMGVLDKKYKISKDDFRVMAKLKTLVPPQEFR